MLTDAIEVLELVTLVMVHISPCGSAISVLRLRPVALLGPENTVNAAAAPEFKEGAVVEGVFTEGDEALLLLPGSGSFSFFLHEERKLADARINTMAIMLNFFIRYCLVKGNTNVSILSKLSPTLNG